MKMRLYDLTLDVETGMPTCGTKWHQAVDISSLGNIKDVGRNTSRIILGSHSGTHMDAPYHFLENGKTMEALDIDLLWGEVKIVDYRDKKQGDIVTLDDVKNIEVKKRMLFVFGWYHNWKTDQYYKSFPYFETDAIEYLIQHGMQVIAMDTPSPDNGDAIKDKGDGDSPCHMVLLRNETIVIEYLANTDVLSEDKLYEMVALPLKLKGADGSPSRVLIREIE